MKNISSRKASEEGFCAAPIRGYRFFRFSVTPFMLTMLLSVFVNIAAAGGRTQQTLRDPAVRQQVVARLASQSQQRKAAAWASANSQAWHPIEQVGHTIFELMAIEDGRVYVYRTSNVKAAISIGADLIRNTAPF
ncbi:MAG: hypothetical protein ACE5NM_13930, partial [Sedimentisphaerales bacterium]